MIITELRKSELVKYNLSIRETPIDKELKAFDNSLLLIWNGDDNQWEIYRVKHSGLDPVYHWQISVPQGRMLTAGLIDWLKKYDSNPMGAKSQEEMQQIFLKNFRDNRRRIEEQKDKEYKDKVIGPFKDLMESASVNRVVTGISKPICVGINKKTGNRVYAYPRGR